MDHQLNSVQARILKESINEQRVCITGSVGCGKSFLLRRMSDRIEGSHLVTFLKGGNIGRSCTGLKLENSNVETQMQEAEARRSVVDKFRSHGTACFPGVDVAVLIVDDVFNLSLPELASLLGSVNDHATTRFVFSGHHTLSRDDERVVKLLECTCKCFQFPGDVTERFKEDLHLAKVVSGWFEKDDDDERYDRNMFGGNEDEFQRLCQPKIELGGMAKITNNIQQLELRVHHPVMVTRTVDHQRLYERAVYEYWFQDESSNGSHRLRDAKGQVFLAPSTTPLRSIVYLKNPKSIRGTTINYPVLVRFLSLPSPSRVLYEVLSRVSTSRLLYYDIPPDLLIASKNNPLPSPSPRLYRHILMNNRTLQNPECPAQQRCSVCRLHSISLRPVEAKPIARISDEGSHIKYLCQTCYSRFKEMRDTAIIAGLK